MTETKSYPCRSCERVDENALFCPHCGQPLPDEEDSTAETTTNTPTKSERLSRRTLVGMLIIVVSPLVLIFLGFIAAGLAINFNMNLDIPQDYAPAPIPTETVPPTNQGGSRPS